MRRTTKVVGYVVREARLLVIRHPDHPAAGLQVPQGTVGSNEDLRVAVVREVLEETGLQSTIGGYLGVTEYDMSAYGQPEVQERHVFQLDPPVQAPYEPWEWTEADPSGGGPPVRFELSWLALDDPTLQLEAGLGALLARVRR